MPDLLQQRFLEYIRQYKLFTPESKLLVAVSGGIDSMVMLHLLHSVTSDCVVAHCNFGLRGDESDADEDFVVRKANDLACHIHTIKFDTKTYADRNGISIQMAARDLRYQWFADLLSRYHYDYVTVAHNRDDRIETLFINLARGTGIKGLAGIQPKTEQIIRPLLFASRDEIVAYAQQENIVFREDSSNASDKYARNYIRHHLIPGLENFFPGVRKIIERDIDHFSGVEALYKDSVERFRRIVTKAQGEDLLIDHQQLMETPSPPDLLFEIIRPYGFSPAVADDVLGKVWESGRRFFSKTHQLLCDRKEIMISPLKNIGPGQFPVDLSRKEMKVPIHLKIDHFDVSPGYVPDKDPNIACLDADTLHPPLFLRKWQDGDRFQPIGMKKMKKLSDFFIDRKLSLLEKEQLWILVSDGKIVWIPGYRMDERYKITDRTKRVVRFTLIR
ncbi:MAG: tRNA lysidine(34) synthetase TilS [Bacteroidales bacterium]|jgi:tRNA(Ile)-lysidine synthase|nr:tRNA lysidine(34) synthetase TilS [Bacteroidales bacterium]